MDEPFFERPILNSPYAYPGRYWELDAQGRQPTGRIIEARCTAQSITPIAQAEKAQGENEAGSNHLGDEVMKVFRVT